MEDKSLARQVERTTSEINDLIRDMVSKIEELEFEKDGMIETIEARDVAISELQETILELRSELKEINNNI